jgi:hypothetical protein
MKKNLLLLLIIILPAFSQLLRPGYFTMHDDLQAARQLEMNKCIVDGQFPCRWVPDMGYGFGYPLFNYYPPLPYLLGAPFHYLGFQDIDIVKIVGILGFLVCAFFMYLLGREFWGRGGGLLASVIYTYAPYHSVDFFVRGAMNEFWAMAFFPAIFYTSYNLIKYSSPSPKLGKGNSGVRYLPWLSLSVAGLMLSHNPMLMIFTPLLLIWCVFWLWRFKSLKSLKYLVLSALYSLGLAAFFTLPVLFEQRFAHVESLTEGYFNFLAHYVPISRVFWVVNWGYGASNLGQTDHLSFFLGYLQWLLPLIVLITMPFIKKLRPYILPILLMTGFALVSIFMLHSKSTPIWLHIDVLKYLQFPWRFLTLAVFSVSFIAGAFALIFNKKYLVFILSLLLTITLLLNADYFRPHIWYPDMTDSKKFSGDSWRLQITGSIFDYLPIYAPLPPVNPPGSDLGITGGIGTFTRLQKTSDFQRYSLNITSPSATVELQTFYFPGWRVWLDGHEVKIDPFRDPLLGRMQVDVTSGGHILIAIFGNTPIRTVGNSLSLLSWLALPFIFYFGVKKKTVSAV